jgi:hypothetical protein
MKRMLPGAACALALCATAGPADAYLAAFATTVTPDGLGGFTFGYDVQIFGFEGLVNGSSFSIADFAGYNGQWTSADSRWALTQVVNQVGPPLAGGPFPNDPTLPDLVFTWSGGDFGLNPQVRTNAHFAFTMGSTFSTRFGFGGVTANMIPTTGSGAGTARTTYGGSPVPGVPEPATWAMLIMGMGMVGLGLRLRRRQASQRTI